MAPDPDKTAAAKGRPPWWAWALLALAAMTVALVALLPGDPGTDHAGEARAKRGGAKATPVSVAPVVRRDFQAFSSYPGDLTGDTADVAANIAGLLTEVHVRLGDAVEAEAPLAAVDDRALATRRAEAAAEVRAASAAALRAKVELDAGRRDLDRVARLEDKGVASAQTADDARARVAALEAARGVAAAGRASAQARLDALDFDLSQAIVRAPFDGVVTRRLRDPGSYVRAGEVLLRVVARAPLRVRFEVPEQHASDVTAGGAVTLRAAMTGAQAVTATVSGIAPEVDPVRRVISVEAVVHDPPERWFPGMYVDVVAARLSITDATVVPEPAVMSRLRPEGDVEYGVFVAEDGVARWIPVEVLGRDAGAVAVSGELAEGAQVLVGGHTDLSDGAPILLPQPTP